MQGMRAQNTQRFSRKIGQRRFALLLMNSLALTAVVVVNVLAQALPMNGLQIGEISDLFVNLLVPSARTFAIWALIYTLLILSQIYQFIASISVSRGDVIEGIGFSLLPVHLLNILWLFSWHYLYRYITTSGFLMILLLLALASLYRKAQRESDFLSERILVLLPVSIYLGWIMAATAVNLTSIFSTLAPAVYDAYAIEITAGTIIAVSLIYAAVTMAYKDLWVSAVGFWALWGIADRHGADPEYAVLAHIALFACAFLAVVLLITIIRRTRSVSDEDELF